MADLIFPNIVGSVNAGYDRGQQQQFNHLAGQYITSNGQDNGAFAQAASINPNAALGVQQDVTATQNAHLAKIAGAANYVLNAVKSGNPAQVQGAYQAVKPFLAELGASQGKVPPDQYTPDMEPFLHQIIAQAGGTQAINQGLTAEQKNRADLYNGLTPEQQQEANRIKVGLDPRATSPNYSVLSVPDGKGGTIQAFYNKRTRQIEQPDYGALGGGQPTNAGPTTPIGLPIANDPMAPYIQVANQRVAAGEDPDKVQTWLQGMAQQVSQRAGGASGSAAPVTGGLGYAPPKGEKDKPPSGYRYSEDGSSLEPIPGGPADKGGSAAQVGDPTKTGADFLASVQDPGMQHMIQAIAEGRMAVPKVYRASKGGEIGAAEIAQAVNSYDPNFDAVNYNARQGTLKDFTSGKSAQTVNSLNTVAEHLGTLSDYADQLNNGNFQLLNKLGNAYMAQTGDPRIAQFDTARKAAADEVAKVWRSTGGSQADIEENLKNLDGAQSPAQLHAAIGTLVQLIGGKLTALQDQYNQGMGIAANRHSIVNPVAQQAFQKVLNKAGMASPDFAPASTPTAAPAAPANGQPDHSSLWGG